MIICPWSEVKVNPEVQSKGPQTSQNKVDKSTSATSVDNFVNDVFDIISPLLLSEVSQWGYDSFHL
jgi:hypothetical protein